VDEVDFEGNEDVSSRFAGCQVWFHLIGSIQRSRSDSFEHRHRELTARLAAQARKAGIPRVVFLTALRPAAGADNAYHQSKLEAEREMTQAGIPGAIVRPGLICGRVVGPRVSKLVQKYIRMITEKGKATVLGAGDSLVQPLDVRDMARCLIEAGKRENKDLAIYDIGGPEQVEFREFVRRLAAAMGREVEISHFPVKLAAVIARIVELFQDKPFITREQVILSQADTICARDSVERQFGFKPRSLAESLKTYGEGGR
jgi:NADH dehydrogenase